MNNLDIKKDFPIFKIYPELVYLDSAATSQKPQVVIDAVADFYNSYNANVHRGIYKLAARSTAAYEGARERVLEFINTKSTREIVFTRNATEAINLVASSYKIENKKILISVMEHHSNIVPWQLAKDNKIEVIGLTEDFRLDIENYKLKLDEFKPDLVAIAHASNTLGTINPIKEIIKLAHNKGAKVLVDGAQAAVHQSVDVIDLDVDFYVFSGHKMLGPTGIGVLYAKEELLSNMNPFLGGGEMISKVSFDKSEWHELPWKFEAGTPNIAGAVGLGYAINYLSKIGFDKISKYEQELGSYALEKLQGIKNLTLYGPKEMKDRLAVFAFTLDGIHAHDIASMFDEENIAIRAGHHCTQPLHSEVLKVPATARASFYLYNTKDDVDRLIAGLEGIIKKFK